MKPTMFPKQRTAIEVLNGYDLTGKCYIVTGANSAIGFETAKALALKNAQVVMACRNAQAAAEAKKKILAEKIDAKVEHIPLDLTDLTSVQNFVHIFLSKDLTLNGLILNAAIMNPEQRITKDGFETTFQVNYLAQFYLTRLLLDACLPRYDSHIRVVLLSASGHKQHPWLRLLGKGQVDANVLSPMNPDKNNYCVAYCRTKLCNVLFANELNRRYREYGITANSVDPGIVRSNIGRSLQGSFAVAWEIISSKLNPLAQDADVGASTVVYLAVSQELNNVGGRYFVNCKLRRPAAVACDKEIAAQLWNISEQMLQTWKIRSNATTI